ncbi:hypothetical protein SDC9_125812 [bioreactor metagenome]|uniref:Uncharacterized protein n=1 Tax=bioreactor metagenome TaxID=1076179 RepID=A0A645CPG8_9ZZZZ
MTVKKKKREIYKAKIIPYELEGCIDTLIECGLIREDEREEYERKDMERKENDRKNGIKRIVIPRLKK